MPDSQVRGGKALTYWGTGGPWGLLPNLGAVWAWAWGLGGTAGGQASGLLAGLGCLGTPAVAATCSAGPPPHFLLGGQARLALSHDPLGLAPRPGNLWIKQPLWVSRAFSQELRRSWKSSQGRRSSHSLCGGC